MLVSNPVQVSKAAFRSSPRTPTYTCKCYMSVYQYHLNGALYTPVPVSNISLDHYPT